MHLKKVCNHPYLFESIEPENIESEEEMTRLLVQASGKLEVLDKMLARLKETGHRVLIFSQVRRLLIPIVFLNSAMLDDSHVGHP